MSKGTTAVVKRSVLALVFSSLLSISGMVVFRPAAVSADGECSQAGYFPETTSLISNGNFSQMPSFVPPTSNPIGYNNTTPGHFYNPGGFYSQVANVGSGRYPSDIVPARNQFSVQTGHFIGTAATPAASASFGLNQLPFPGDPTYDIPATNTWWYSNGNALGNPGNASNDAAREYLIWEQDITGLEVGKEYVFVAYISNVIEPTDPAVSPGPPDYAPHDPRIRFKIGGDSGQEDGDEVLGLGVLTEEATGNTDSLNGWQRVAFSFTADETGEKLKLVDSSYGIIGDDFAMTAITMQSCETTLPAPYFQAYGGDVRVGSGFESSSGLCSTDSAARIIGWNTGGPNFVGAGAQLAAFAFSQINEFASGQMRTNTAKSLTFANTNPSNGNFGTDTYGGGLQPGNAVCASNYYAGAATAANTINTGSIAVDTLDSGTYIRNGDLTINSSTLALGSGTRVIYVNGNVTVNGFILYASANATYGNVDNIPGLRLIVQGNIYVRPGVGRMDGIYIAQPDSSGNGGRFYTCAPGSGPPSAAQVNGVCQNKLTVYGAVVADVIKLGRSSGTLDQAGDTSLLPSQEAAGSAAAEVFVMTPEVWLTSDFAGNGSFDAITTLPPVL